MGLHKIFKIVVLILSLVGVIFGIMIISGSDAQIDNMMYVAYTVFIVALIFVVLFTLKNTLSNPETLKGTLMGLGAFALVGLLCYFVLANGVETPLRDGEVLSANGSKLVGAGLYMFYALVIIACGSMLFSGVKKMIK